MKIKTKAKERKPQVSYSLNLSRYEAEILHDVLCRHTSHGMAPTLNKMSEQLHEALTGDTDYEQRWPERHLINDNQVVPVDQRRPYAVLREYVLVPESTFLQQYDKDYTNE